MKGKITKILALFTAYIMIFSFLQFQSLVAGEKKINLSYIYTGNPSAYTGMVDKTRNSLDVVCPSYFDLDTNGLLKLNSSISTSFVTEMHKRGIKVTPFLSNHWDRALGRKALANRDKLSSQIVEAIKKYNLDGVNIDLENLNHEDRKAYVDFVKLLREKLGSGKIVSVAVAANPKGLTTDWPGSYDYSGLAQYSDYLMMMTYDESYQGSAPGPVASAQFVEKSIIYALGKVSKDKILLGIPFYGRYWKNGDATGGYGIPGTTIKSLVEKYNGVVEYDEARQSAKATFTIKAGDAKPTVSGTTLTAGTYTVWFDNEKSYKYKLRLVQKYGLRGTGSWALGQEVPELWDYYSLWLNGKYFSDAEGHWAQEAILKVDGLGWMTGSTSTLFKPNNNLLRAEAAAILVRALGLRTDDSSAAFPDTQNHWARKEINAVYKAGLMIGDSEGNFNPNNPITREELAVILDRALNLKDVTLDYYVYPDVNPLICSWSYQSIGNTSYYGLFQGSGGLFRPRNLVNRAEMATVMVRVYEYMERQKNQPSPSPTPVPSPTPSPEDSVTPTPSGSPSPKVSPEQTPSASPVSTLTTSPAATMTPSPAPTSTGKIVAKPKTSPKPSPT